MNLRGIICPRVAKCIQIDFFAPKFNWKLGVGGGGVGVNSLCVLNCDAFLDSLSMSC